MRTYSSRKRATNQALEGHVSDLEPSTSSQSKKRASSSSETSDQPRKRVKGSLAGRSTGREAKPKQKTLVQLHFCIDQSIIKKCSICGLRYTQGAQEDMALHRTHCIRVQKGLEWGREEEKEGYGSSISEIESRVTLENKKVGRIITIPCDVTGRLGAKLSTLLETINVCLSAPALEQTALQDSKAYLFLIPEGTRGSTERIAGCVIAQRIKTAMAVIPAKCTPEESTDHIDVGGVFCYPEPLPTTMGISRLFVPSTFRRQGIAQRLLSAAAASFVPGCVLDPKEGQIAFSQPTGDGAKIMQSWGDGHVRIYEED
ncbi:hypothetical protein BKA70DRAFT_1554734 [Coprinopsis sp. MPI-PUGE-AT-0042]|nr:hypothetical protein BKA70DRAFT_1554734 [Coprinopsis sp. MPI-PUGE-AT-0042]